MGRRLSLNAGTMTRVSSQLHSHLDELTRAVAKQDWVYAHRVASALARLSRAAGDGETQSAAAAVCYSIERSGDEARIHAAVRRLCLPLAAAMENESGPDDCHADKHRVPASKLFKKRRQGASQSS